MLIYIILISIFLLAGIIGTIRIGMSRENKEGNPEYETRTKGNWSRLTLYYVIAGAVGILAVIGFIYFG